MAEECKKKTFEVDSKEKISNTQEDDDKELDDLLDSALEDFDNIPQTIPPTTSTSEAQLQDKLLDANAFGDGVWGNEFLQASAAYEDVFKNLVGDDPEAMDEFKKFVSVAGKMATEPDVSATAQGFLSGLAASAQAFSDDSQPAESEEELNKLFGSLGLSSSAESGDDGGAQVPALVQNMMQMLLSRDLLYPALHEITEKYPSWLAENKETLQSQQFDTYTQQYEFMKQICTDFEQEKEGDSDSVKRERFERILDTMKKVQECGHPPASLVGDGGNFGLEFDESGEPKIPGLTNNFVNDKCNMQ